MLDFKNGLWIIFAVFHPAHTVSLIYEMLVNLRTDLHIKAYSTKKLLGFQEHVKLCLGNSDLIVNTCVDHECQMIVN